jgi:hypothetical protein
VVTQVDGRESGVTRDASCEYTVLFAYSLSLSPSLPLSLSPSLPLSLSPSLPLSLSPSLPLTLSPSLPLSLSHTQPLLPLSLSDSPTVSSRHAGCCVALDACRGLELSANRLSGTLPQSLSVLSDLESLVLDSNAIGGTIPDALSTLTRLTYVRLRAFLLGTWHGITPQCRN